MVAEDTGSIGPPICVGCGHIHGKRHLRILVIVKNDSRSQNGKFDHSLGLSDGGAYQEYGHHTEKQNSQSLAHRVPHFGKVDNFRIFNNF